MNVESTETANASPEPTNEKATTDEGWQTLMGDDMVMKILPDSQAVGKVNTSQEPKEIQHGDTVLVNFIARIADTRNDTDGTIVQRVEGWLLGIGDGDVLPAIEMGIRFLKTGQTGRVWSTSKYAWGPGRRVWKGDGSNNSNNNDNGDDGEHTSAELPPNTNVLFDITVTQLVVDTSRLNPYFTIQRTLTRKKIANDIFACEFSANPKIAEAAIENSMSIPRAIRLYQKAATDMETLLNGTYFANVEADHPQKAQCQKLQLDCLNNISVVFMRQGRYHEAKEAAVKVLAIDKHNLKALLRAAKASLLDPASTLEEAKAALDAADSAVTYKNPVEEKEIKRLRIQYKQKAKEYKDKSKAMFAKSFAPTKRKPSVDEMESVGETIATARTATAATTEEEQDTSKARGGTELEPGIFDRTNVFLLAFQLVLPIVMYGLYTLMRNRDHEQEL